MEALVSEEVERQLHRMPSKLADYINVAEVVAYALNRLPALYATSEKGWQQQRLRGKTQFGTQIATAVRQAFVAVQRDPLRVSTPLPNQISVDLEPQIALQQLRELLRIEELSWRNLVDKVEQTLTRATRGEVTWRRRKLANESHEWKDSRYQV